MRINLTLSLLCMLMLMSCASVNSDTDTKSTERVTELMFVLKTEKQVYDLGEPVKVNVYIRNITQQDIWIIRPAIKGVNVITEIRGDREKIRYDNYKMSSSKSRRKRFLINSQSEVFYANFSYDKKYFKRKGMWNLHIAELFRKVKGEDDVKHWSGKILSNRIEIEVI